MAFIWVAKSAAALRRRPVVCFVRATTRHNSYGHGLYRDPYGPHVHYHALPPPPEIRKLHEPEHMLQAQSWVDNLRKEPLPKSLIDMSFSRSSGPGGQNVNKVNTKVTARFSTDAEWVPEWAVEHLRASPFYAANSKSIIVTSSQHRSQAQNIDVCLSKLKDIIADAASRPIRKEPSPEQKERVRQLELADASRRRAAKIKLSAKKASRSTKGWD